MRRTLAAALVAVAVLLQVSLLPAVRPLGVVPNLALVMMVLVSLNMATSEALVLAAIGGVILDVASGTNFGLWTGVLMLMSLVVGLLHRTGIELARALVSPALVAAGTLIIAVVIWLGLATQGGGWPGASLAARLGIELVINLGLTLGLSPVVRFVLGGSGSSQQTGG